MVVFLVTGSFTVAGEAVDKLAGGLDIDTLFRIARYKPLRS